MSDFNLDLLQYNHHTPTQEFINSRIYLTRDGENKAFIHKFNDENLRKFNENVSNTDWSSLLDEDPNIAYNNFIDEYSRIYNACLKFPLKAIKGKLLNNRSSPWISPGLLKAISKNTDCIKSFLDHPLYPMSKSIKLAKIN